MRTERMIGLGALFAAVIAAVHNVYWKDDWSEICNWYLYIWGGLLIVDGLAQLVVIRALRLRLLPGTARWVEQNKVLFERTDKEVESKYLLFWWGFCVPFWLFVGLSGLSTLLFIVMSVNLCMDEFCRNLVLRFYWEKSQAEKAGKPE